MLREKQQLEQRPRGRREPIEPVIDRECEKRIARSAVDRAGPIGDQLDESGIAVTGGGDATEHWHRRFGKRSQCDLPRAEACEATERDVSRRLSNSAQI